MISITITSENAQITVTCSDPADLLSDAAAAVAAHQNLAAHAKQPVLVPAVSLRAPQ